MTADALGQVAEIRGLVADDRERMVESQRMLAQMVAAYDRHANAYVEPPKAEEQVKKSKMGKSKIGEGSKKEKKSRDKEKSKKSEAKAYSEEEEWNGFDD